MKAKKILSILTSAVMLMSAVIPYSAQAVTAQEEQSQTAQSTNDGEMKATSSIGATIMNVMDEEQTQQSEQTEGDNSSQYNVNEIVYDESTNTALINSYQERECDLTIVMYNNEGTKKLESKTINASPDVHEYTVSFTYTPPEYYLIKAYLTDKLLQPLSPVCTYSEGTKEMQAIKNAKIDDFDADKVINLDDSTSNNFMVLDDNAVTAESDNKTNLLISQDIDKGVYTFGSIDDTIKSLKAGDSFCIQPDDNDVIAIVIADISIDGDTAVLTADKENAKDAFSFIKIDSVSDGEKATVDMTEADEGVEQIPDLDENFLDEYEVKDVTGENDSSNEFVTENAPSAPIVGGLGDIDIEGSGSYGSISFSLSSGKFWEPFKVTIGSAKIDNKVDFRLYHDTVFFGDDYNFIEFKYTTKASFCSNIEVSGKYEKDYINKKSKTNVVKLGKISIPLGGTGICLEVDVNLELSVSAKLSVSYEKKTVSGLRYETDTGWTNIKEDPNPKTKCSIEGEVFIGFVFEVSASWLGDLFKLSFPFKIGVRIKGELDQLSQPAGLPDKTEDIIITDDTSSSDLHYCTACISGGFYIEADISIKLSFLFGVIEFKGTIAKFSFKLFDFHINDDGFGLGKCPNKYYKMTVHTMDKMNKLICYTERAVDKHPKIW